MSKGSIRSRTKRKAAKIVKSQNNKCYLCDKSIYHLSEFKKQNVVGAGKNYIHINNEDGTIKRFLRATIDHKKRVVDGGSSNLENLAACCLDCHNKKDGHIKRRITVCHQCRKDKNPNRHKICDDCHEANKVKWLINCH